MSLDNTPLLLRCCCYCYTSNVILATLDMFRATRSPSSGADDYKTGMCDVCESVSVVLFCCLIGVFLWVYLARQDRCKKFLLYPLNYHERFGTQMPSSGGLHVPRKLL